jgi:alpha-glucosidase
MIDFWNPDAWDWTKEIIKQNMINEASGAAWMHDFGEYLPFDAVVHDGTPIWIAHNEYPLKWAQVVEEALSEIENGGDVVPFMRAATGTSPQHTRLFWMGD